MLTFVKWMCFFNLQFYLEFVTVFSSETDVSPSLGCVSGRGGAWEWHLDSDGVRQKAQHHEHEWTRMPAKCNRFLKSFFEKKKKKK